MGEGVGVLVIRRLRLRFFGGVDRKNEEVREKILIKGIKKLGEE